MGLFEERGECLSGGNHGQDEWKGVVCPQIRAEYVQECAPEEPRY